MNNHRKIKELLPLHSLPHFIGAKNLENELKRVSGMRLYFLQHDEYIRQ